MLAVMECGVLGHESVTRGSYIRVSHVGQDDTILHYPNTELIGAPFKSNCNHHIVDVL